MKAEYKDVINYRDGLNQDIIKVLESNFQKAKKQTENFCLQFEAGNMLDTCNNVWDYVKNNIPYKADGTAEQKIILPARLVERAENGIGADCKSFALFCAANISNLYPDADVNFRYTCYRSSKIPSHVYCIVKTNRGIIKIDPVWHYFNKEKEYKHKIDHSMRIATLSGVNDKSKIKVDVQTYETLRMLKKAADAYPRSSNEYLFYITQFNIVAESAGLDDPTINGFFGKVKDAFKKVADKVKDEIKKVEKKVKDGAKDLVDDIKTRPEWASKEDKIKHLVKKPLRLFIAMRTAFMLALTVNYRNFCNRILEANAADPHKIERIWYKGFGGDPKALLAACEANKNKKPFFGKPKRIKGIGNYDGIVIGAADGTEDIDDTTGQDKTGKGATAASAAGAAATSIAMIAGMAGPQAAGLGAAITLAFSVISIMGKAMKKDDRDDGMEGETIPPPPPTEDLPPGPPGTDVPDAPPGTTYGPNGEIVPPSATAGLFTTKNILIGGAALAALFIVPKLIKK